MENGIALFLLSRLSERFLVFYRESLICKLVYFVSSGVKKLFSYSCIWRFISRPERTTEIFKGSITAKLLKNTADLILKILRRLGKLVKSSVSGHIISLIIKRPAVLPGAFVFIQTIVPHHFWYNWVNLALTFAVLILYLVKCATDKNYKLKPLRLDFTVLLFIVINTVAALTSLEIADSIRIYVLNMLIPMIIVLIMVSAINTKKDIQLFSWMLISGMTIACLYGLWQYATGIEVDVTLVDTEVSGSIRRLFSTMGNPNNFAEYLVICIPLYAAMFFNVKTIRAKLVVAVLILFPLSNLILTSSRSSWLGLAAAALIFIFLTYRKVLPLLIIAGIALIPLLPDSILHRLTTIGRDSSSKYRLVIWKGSLNMLKDYWLTGIGQGPAPFISLFPRYSYLSGVVHSHMLPLQIWLETGISGLLAFVWMLARLFKKSALYSFATGASVPGTLGTSVPGTPGTPGGKTDAFLRNINAAAISGIAGMVFIGMFEYVWFYPRVMSIFWIITGLLISSIRISSKLNSVKKEAGIIDG